MSYLPRYQIVCDGSYFHVTWRCHNKDWLLHWDWAKKIYYDLLLKYKDRYGVVIHAYSFMDNHPHLIGQLLIREKFSEFFQVINCQLAKQINKRLQRCGQVVMDRFKSPRIESDDHMLKAMVYVDLNQYRAGKVTHPRFSRWSSYNYYADGKPDPLITPSPSYEGLGGTPEARRLAYRNMVDALLKAFVKINISHAYFIGSPDWVIARYKELRIRLKNNFLFAEANSPPG